MQVKINNASFGYGGETLFENLSLEINPKDKIGIIGRNGCGKSTLLRIFSGEIELHQPESAPKVFEVTGKPEISSLRQMGFEDETISLYDEILKCYQKIINLESKIQKLQIELEQNATEKLVNEFTKCHDEFERLGGYHYRAEIDEVLASFGLIEQKYKRLSEFSGGQKTKIAFIKLILSKPDVLLLDEPTNHLDLKAISWLENYIKEYKKAIVIVSHDRTFLDNTVSFIAELENKHLTLYAGGYSKYVKAKAENYESAMRAYEAQQRKIADIKAFIERFRYKATKAAAVQSRVKMLEKMEILPKPEKPNTESFFTKIKPEFASGSEVLSCTNLKIGYSPENPLASITLKLLRGDRLAVIGGNGLGKSTFLKVLADKLAPLSGHFKFGYNVSWGYFEQVESRLFSTKSVFEYYSECFPDLSGNEVRNLLGAFLFSGADVSKRLDSLSGGEIVRLELCKLLQTKPNLLILDEPTNHMDIASKEAFERLLLAYEGTIIFVSHDRYFVSKIATKILNFDDGGATFFEGTYAELNDPHPKQTLVTQENKIPEQSQEKIEYPVDYGEETNPFADLSPYQASKEKVKLENRLKKIEEKSLAAENKLKELNAAFVDETIGSDFKKLMDIQAEMESTQILINKLADEWVETSENYNNLLKIFSDSEKSE